MVGWSAEHSLGLAEPSGKAEGGTVGGKASSWPAIRA